MMNRTDSSESDLASSRTRDVRRRKKVKTTFAIASSVLLAGSWLAAQDPGKMLAKPQTPTLPQSAPAAGQPARPPMPPQFAGNESTRRTEKGQYLGSGTCGGSSCHGSTAALDVTDILQNEFFTWSDRDPHAGAYNLLFNKESELIARNMRIGKAWEAKICLDCHATNVPAKLQNAPDDIKKEGISCESCHGPAGGWRSQHMQSTWKHADSVKAGMIDLRILEKRAVVCMSCHVGNKSQQVDHELIGAGHPLLAFELDNYSEAMPPHWRPFAEKRNKEGLRDTHGIQAWGVGQAVALRESLDLLVAHAKSDRWPEFGDMACLSCHHSLKGSEWRQERGWKDRAGLPMWSPVRWSVLRHVVSAVAPEERAALDKQVDEIAKYVARMGEPKKVVASAEAARRIADRLIDKLDRANWDERRIRGLMTTISNDSKYYLEADHQAAEQSVLALHSLGSYLVRMNPRLGRSDMMRSIDQLNREIQDWHEFDNKRFAAALEKVNRVVR